MRRDQETLAERQSEAQQELTFAGYYSTAMFPPVELLYVSGTENDAVAAALQQMWSGNTRGERDAARRDADGI